MVNYRPQEFLGLLAPTQYARTTRLSPDFRVRVGYARLHCQSSPVIGPGLVSTSPATTSNKHSARHSEYGSIAHTLPHRFRRTHIQHRALPTSLFREESAPFPASHTLVATVPTSENSSMTHNIGRASEITRSRCRFSGTRGRDPQCVWYHRSFLFSQ